MSRFDLFFIIQDEKNDQNDMNIARHIVNMHRLQDKAFQSKFNMETLQTYIKACRTLNPRLTKAANVMLKKEFIALRQSMMNRGAQQTSYRYTTRQLESLIRLSEAMARVHGDNYIRVAYVKEVCRLLKTSNIMIKRADLEFQDIQEEMNDDLRQRQHEEEVRKQ